MDNSAFRNLLSQAKSKESDSSSKPAAETSEAKAARLAKQAERKAAYEKRMAVQAKRQEKLAEEAKYVDRAAQRRKELAKAGVTDEAPPLAGLEELMELEEGPVIPKVPDGPTFAQVAGDGREDLAQQQHRLSIAQSKYLGGDIEHTHLVKGLDFALLQKRRAELEAAPAAASAADPKPAKPTTKPSASTVAVPPAAGGGAAGGAAGDLARGVAQLAVGGIAALRPSKALTSGRLLYVYSLDARSADTPNSLVRAEDDLTISRQREKLRPAGLPPTLLSKLSKVLAYCARPAGERPRKSKKERAIAPVPGLRMRPLQLPDPGPARDGGGLAAQGAPRPPTEPAPKVPGSKAAAPAAAATSAPAKPEADVDDIFGDVVGSDYICAPTERQAKEAEVERRLALREGKGGKVAEADVDAMSDGDGGDEASQLLKDALTQGAAEAGPRPARERAGGGVAAPKGKPRGVTDGAPAKEKGVSMGGVMDDSYAECFPDSFERYNMELGPDSDDETGLVRSDETGRARSTHEEGAEEAGAGKPGKGGKKRPVDRDKVEAQKAEAKMDRDLVQIEKLMEERSQKKARGESLALGSSGRAGKGTSRGGEPDQNELF